MALLRNPTKTRHIENRWNKDLAQRFHKFNSVMKGRMKDLQEGKFSNASVFEITDQEIARIIRLLRLDVSEIILGDELASWQDKFISRSYAQGVQVIQDDLDRWGIRYPVTPRELRILYGALSDDEIAEMLLQALPESSNAPQTIEGLRGIASDSLIDTANDMIKQMRQTMLSERGVNGFAEIVRSLTKRVDVALSSGENNATTSTTKAFRKGAINHTKMIEEQAKEKIDVRWLTRRDDRVRYIHAFWHGEVMTTEEADKRIEVSPWRCRCGLAAVPKRANTKKRQLMFDRERARLLSVIKVKPLKSA